MHRRTDQPRQILSGTRLHASCVALDGRGLLIMGAAGSGKSALALRMMAYGAELVSDDQTILTSRDGWPVASAPEALRGMIEARGIGLLAATACPAARVVLAIDLDIAETDRLPPDRELDLPGQPVPLLHKVATGHGAAALLQYLRGGRVNC